MLETKHHWLPIIIAIYLPVSFVITYSIAVANDHVEPGFPYISDTGTRSPESCVFGQLLNIGAVLAGMIIYTRYRHGLHHFQNTGRRTLLHLNTAAFVIGILTVFGVSLVGNFQETNVLIVHLLGAFLAFAVGFVYMIFQTVISFKSTSCDVPGNTLCIRRFRVGLCVAELIFLILLIIMTAVAGSKGPGYDSAGNAVDPNDWSADNPGYSEHLAATISEWLVAFITVTFFATFYTEFKHFRMKAPEVVYHKEHQRTEISVIS